MDKRDIVDVLVQERRDLRAEATEFRRIIHNAVTVFIVFAGGLAAAYANLLAGMNEAGSTVDAGLLAGAYGRALVFGVTQAEYFLGLFVLSLFVAERARTPLIALLGQQINAQTQQQICLWYGGRPGERELYRVRGVFFWIILVMILMAFAAFAFAGVFLWQAPRLQRYVMESVMLIELVVLVWVGLGVISELNRIREEIRERYRVGGESQQPD